MISLLKLLPQLLRQAGDSEEARQQAVFAAWVVAVGPQVRKVTSPLRLERKTLIVAVPDETWRSQLKRIRGQALFSLNSALKAPAVTSIEFVVNKELAVHPLDTPPEVSFHAPEQQALALRDKAEQISNPDIRDAFLRAAGKCLDRRAR